VKRAQRCAIQHGGLGGFSSFDRIIAHQGHDGIDLRIGRFYPVKMRPDDLDWRQLLRPDQAGEFGCIAIKNLNVTVRKAHGIHLSGSFVRGEYARCPASSCDARRVYLVKSDEV
jgi:hypothetical protein